MRGSRFFIAAFFVLGLLASARLGAFMFWLESPERSNHNDPKSPRYNGAQLTPFVFPTFPPAATQTSTQTLFPTPPPATATPSFTASPTVSPTRTISPVLTATPSPTMSQTYTASPVFSPTMTSTQTPLATLTHGPLVADLENAAAQDRTLWNDGPVITVKDGLGSTQNPNPWTATSGTAGGAYGSSSYAACMSGNMLVQIGAPTNQYPFCFMAFELIPSGSAPASGGGVDVDVSPYSANSGLRFDYRAGAAGVIYRVKLISTAVTDFGYYEWKFTSVDAAWHTATVYFPGVPGPGQRFAQPSWGAAVAFDATRIGAIMFEPEPQTSGPVNYDLCIDNISFEVPAVPTPVPTPTFGTGTVIMDFEDNSANNMTLAPFAQGVSTGKDGASSVNPFPWTAASGTAPGSDAMGPASSYAGCYSGSLIAQDPPNGIYPYGVMELLLAANGWGNGGGAIDVAPYAPGKRLIFDYKAGAPGLQYGIQIITSNVSDYAFYEHLFTPSNTQWNTLVVYFPDSPFGPKFMQPSWGVPRAWDPALAGEILVRAVPVTGSPVNFDLCIDNLRFD